MVPDVNQALSPSRLDKPADTLTERHGQLVRNFKAEFAMAKPPGYSKKGSRVRFQRRIPEDVRHAFNGKEWICIPLDFPTEREAKRSALAWFVIYEEEFAEIRYEAEFGKRAVPRLPSKKPLSEFTPAEMQALVKPVAEELSQSQYTAIATGAASFNELAASHAKLDIAVRDVLRGQGSEYFGVLMQLFLMSRGIEYDIKRFKERRVSLAELLEETDGEGLSETTCKDSYRATLTKFLKHALRDYGDQGFPVLTADYEYTGTQRGTRDKQRHLEEPELVRLFEGVEFAAIAADPALEHRYWLPIIGLFTGARPREICQLNLQCDWGEMRGVWFLTVDENTPAGDCVTKSIKTGERRLVPLHPELVRLGLPEYLSRMRDSGADRLFPRYRIKGGNPYMIAGAEFSDLLRTVGLYDNQTNGAKVTGMYVFRKTFATYGDEQDINVAPFVGHRNTDKTITEKHYITRAKEMPWLFERFAALDFSVSIPRRGWLPAPMSA